MHTLLGTYLEKDNKYLLMKLKSTTFWENKNTLDIKLYPFLCNHSHWKVHILHYNILFIPDNSLKIARRTTVMNLGENLVDLITFKIAGHQLLVGSYYLFPFSSSVSFKSLTLGANILVTRKMQLCQRGHIICCTTLPLLHTYFREKKTLFNWDWKDKLL